MNKNVLLASCVILILILLKCELSYPLVLGVPVLLLYLKDNPIQQISGGNKHEYVNKHDIEIWHNPKYFNIKGYDKYYWMAQKLLRNSNKPYTKKYKENLHSLVDYSFNKKRWGFTEDKDPESIIRYKFSDTIFDKISGYISSVKIPQYLDYGCGNGSITHALHKLFNTKSFCIDIDDYRKYDSSSFIYNTDINAIDNHITNGTLDIISAIQSLHHVNFNKNDINDYELTLDTILKQMYSKLKTNGLLLIREHDVRSLNELYPVLMEHLLFELLEYNAKGMNTKSIYRFINDFIENYHKDHYGWYFSHNFIHNKLIELGFKKIHFEYKKGKNVSRIYNALYIKN
jgi:2-polyprenyl-3-methyl-5-hydroxy-6-metoxy-1,4-benzoquinol methylase